MSAGGDRPVVALVAHDDKKAALAAWAQRHGDVLRGCILYATGTTGGRVLDAVAGLDLTRLKSGPLGGDQQIGALIAEGRIDALIFFVDPLSPHPHDVDVKALMRVALVYDIPMALSESTAELIIAALAARVQGAGPAERGRSMSTNS